MSRVENATAERLKPLLARYGSAVPRYTSYPTAPHFNADVNGNTYAAWLKSLPKGASLSLYVHVPFCDTLCWFCGCHTTITRRYEPVAAYHRQLRQEIDRIAALVPEHRVTHLHFGGGSPTILSGPDLVCLVEHLREAFRFQAGAEIAIEIDPRDLDGDKIGDLARAGITRASVGVQDFNPGVQKSINRIQSFELTAEAIDGLRAAGIRRINTDVMYGLPGQTVNSVLATVDKACALAPDRLALFGYAHVPWMKKHQQLIDESLLPSLPERLDQAEAAAARLVARGYERIGFDHFATPDDRLAVAAREGRLNRNFQGYTDDAADGLIGMGPSAIGSLPQGYVQNTPDMPAYRRLLADGVLPTVRGIAVSPDDVVERAIIERLMCDMAVNLEAVSQAHGATADRFLPLLDDLRALEADGLVEIDWPRLSVPRRTRPFVRHVAAVFDRYLKSGAARHSSAV